MDKNALFHEPISQFSLSQSYSEKRELSALYEIETQKYLNAGGVIELVTGPTLAQLKLSYNNIPVTDPARQKRVHKASEHYGLNKELAREQGRATFVGAQCKKCSGYDRWVKNGGCIVCKPSGGTEFSNIRKRAGEAKKHAEVNDLPTYNGLPCGKCGATLRETYHGDCVACIRETKQSLVRARNARRKNEPKPE